MNASFETWVFRRFPEYHMPHENEYLVRCPLCDKEKKFTMNPVKKLYRCFACGEGGQLMYALTKLYGLSFKDAYKLLYREVNVEDFENDTTTVQQAREIAAQKREEADRKFKEDLTTFTPVTEEQRAYLRGRGFHDGVVEEYGLCSNKYGRLVIPIWEGGHIVYYQARAIDDSKPKYMNPKGKPKGGFVFNLETAQQYISYGLPLIITEGAFSAMSIGRHAVAVLGKELSKHQLARLSFVVSQAPYTVVAFDYGAEVEAEHAKQLLEPYGVVQTAVLPTEADWNDILRMHGKEAVEQHLSYLLAGVKA